MAVRSPMSAAVEAGRTRVVPLTPAEWRDAVGRFRDRDFQHSVAYLAALATDRREVLELWAIEVGDRRAGLAAVRIRHLPLRVGGIGVVAGGPLVASDDQPDPGGAYRLAVAALGRSYARRGVRVHVRPPFLAAVEGWFDAGTGSGRLGEPSAILPGYRTAVLDLDRPLDELRAGLSQRWRSRLNRAGRAGVDVAEVAVGEGWSRFETMYTPMRERKRFHSAIGVTVWRSVVRDPRAADEFRLFLARQDGADVAGLLLGGSGAIATYVLGASSAAGRECHAGYAVQWAAVAAAHERGQRGYDLGGIDEVANPGGHQFKRGMRGADLEGPEPFALAGAGIRQSGLRLAERAAVWAQQRRH